MRATIEHEQKLEAPAGWELPPLDGEEIEPRVFTSVYHDTATRSLARSGITLRRRMERGKSVWQLKLPSDAARLELEVPGGPVGPPEPLGALLRAHVRHGPLAPVAELRTRRHGRRVDGAEVLVDEVRVMDAQRVVEEFREIEVEGEPSAVRTIAKELQKAGAQAVDLTPKLLRALPLPGRDAPRTSFESFRALLREQLEAILANDPGVRHGGDDENVHKMRVATRRSRALLRAARPLYDGDVEPLTRELKWLADVLGSVRDLDVLLAHLNAEADALAAADAAAAHRLLRTMQRNRSRYRRALLSALDSPRYGALLDRFDETIDALTPSGDDTPLRALADRELKKLRREVKALPDEPEDEQLHAVRKRGKRVRYAFELAAVDKTVRRAKDLQDVLGEHQDSVIAEARLRALAAGAPPEQAIAAGMLIAREQKRHARARSQWRKAFERL